MQVKPPLTVPDPQLAAPGAGLPPVELFVARRLFRLRCRLTSRAGAETLIRDEQRKISAIAAAVDPVAAEQRVLIPRPRGLEDSSRHWSVLMTLEHLRMVNEAVAGAVRDLRAGRVPATTASTAAVKPSAEVGRSVIPAFRASCEAMLAAGAGARSLVTPLRYGHPWFGPLSAAEWIFLGGFHLGLHRRQLVMIGRVLRRDAASRSP
jgi:hypothetical protein